MGCIVTGLKLISDISELIKTVNPQSGIIAGNSVATSIPELFLRKTNVDIAVIGEGDITIVELLLSLISGSDLDNVNGIAYLDDDKFIKTNKRQDHTAIRRYWLS